MPIVLAVDIGGTKTVLARVDEEGSLSDRQSLASARSLDGSVEQIARIARASRHVDAIGIIVPGIYTPMTGTAWCPNLWGTECPRRARVGDAAVHRDATGAGVRVPAVLPVGQ
jgi:predicted NBD/HSP70 family sugar kinase